MNPIENATTCSSETCHVCWLHRLRWVFFAGIWSLSLASALTVAEIPAEGHGTSLCGVWGCYPPLQAVAAMHLFWSVVLVAPIYLVARFWTHYLTSLGTILFLLGAIGFAVFVGSDLHQWLSAAGEGLRHHWPKRMQRAILTTTDFPMVQLMLGGLICWAISRRNSVTEMRIVESKSEGV